MFRRCVFCLCLSALLLAALPSLAQADTADILACLQARYPQAQPTNTVQCGDTAAVVFLREGKPCLCVLERRDGQWQLAVCAEDALYPDRTLSSLHLEMYDSLFWTYRDAPLSEDFHAVRTPQGVWEISDIRCLYPISDTAFSEHWLSLDEKTNLWVYEQALSDANDNLLWWSDWSVYLPVIGADSGRRLETFAPSSAPVLKTMDSEWPSLSYRMQAAAELMPGYTYIGGALVADELQWLLDAPDGTRVLAVPRYTGSGWEITISSPLPQGTCYGVENLSTYLAIDPADFLFSVYRGGVRYVLDDIMLRLGPQSIHDGDSFCFGEHPWSDITCIDWETLPRTLSEAADSLHYPDDWALVINPNPADRLNLRESPSQQARSLGKYYTGTPVRVLRLDEGWAEVEVFGRHGWMMREFLQFTLPLTSTTSAMPCLTLRDDARCYAACDTSAESWRIAGAGERLGAMHVIGVIGDTWYHVWYPEVGQSGFMLQSDLLPGSG